VKFCIKAASYVGCIRERNEDMVLVGQQFVRDDDYAEIDDLNAKNRLIVALADGMGGHKGGEVASSDVLHNLAYYYGDMPTGLSVQGFMEAIQEWLKSINNIIDSKGRSEPCYYNMGTTLVGFAYYEGEFFWMNCGDSRLYQLRKGELRQLSTDHSLNSLTGEAGHSNIIVNCIGGGCKASYIDIMKCTESVHVGDIFMLCSDGLSDMVTDHHILEMLMNGADANALCQAAIINGGIDNVSVCVIKIEE